MIAFSHFYPISKSDLLQGLLRWADQNFDFFAYFDGNDYTYPEGPIETLFFAGNTKIEGEIVLGNEKLFEKVGVISYDFKNQIENLQSENPEFFPLPDLCFFEPEVSIRFADNGFFSKKPLSEPILNEILNLAGGEKGNTACQVNPHLTQEEYIHKIQNIQSEILEGNTYEANFCQTYSGEFETWDPIAAFLILNELSTMPFAGLFKAESKWLVSASPERFLKKKGNRLIAQPIKGTVRRGENPTEDQANRQKLISSEKERAENLMITDLMRNDLSKVSQTGSVEVDELFGIYPFPRVFQMISSVSSELRKETTFREIIQATFPMGSMTGAPKISTMKIIEREENFKRGWFSGAFGWIDADGDFDFSVIIRSIVADLSAKKLYFGVGSAITIDASAEKEYQECALKAQAILELLSGK